MDKRYSEEDENRILKHSHRRQIEELEEEELDRELQVVKQWARGGMSLIELETELDYIS